MRPSKHKKSLTAATDANVRVITPDKLTEVLDGKSGRVKRA